MIIYSFKTKSNIFIIIKRATMKNVRKTVVDFKL